MWGEINKQMNESKDSAHFQNGSFLSLGVSIGKSPLPPITKDNPLADSEQYRAASSIHHYTGNNLGKA